MPYNNEILKMLKARDRGTIESIYKHLFPRINGWINLNSGTREDAEDIFHDSLLCLIMKLDHGGMQLTCDFSTYFISVCRNKWFQVLYKRKVRSCVALDEANETPEDVFDLMEKEEKENRRYQVFIAALHDLDLKSQAVMEASFNGKTNEEIAAEMGFMNTQAVADKKKNCKKRLIQILSHCVEYRELRNEQLRKHRAYSK